MYVADSSTVILLARIELLKAVAERSRILMTEEVYVECTVKETMDSRLIQNLVEAGMITLETLTKQDQALVKRLRTDFKVGKGEASALALAYRKGMPLATDDQLAMKVAKLLSVGFVTALHLLIDAYESKRIDQQIALAKLEKLRALGRYSERILADVKRRLGGEA